MDRRVRVRRRGSAMLWAMLSTPVMVGFISFGVDWGRIQLSKSELNNALDASTRYAVTGLTDSTASAKAISAAGQNNVIGRSLVLTAADVSTGSFDATTRVFTVNGTPANAVLIRKTLGGTSGVPMAFGTLFGRSHAQISGYGCAMISGSGSSAQATGALAGFVGLNWFNINGSLTVRAWDSATQAATDSSTWAAGQTQGNINLNSGVNFQGEIQHTAGGGVSMNQATVTKGITNLAAPLNYAMPTTPGGTTNMGNYNGPSGSSQTFAAGKYYFDTFNVPNGKTVIFSGPVELYVNGSCNISGAVQTFNNVPANLKINIVSGAGGDLGSNTSPLYMDLYAPGSPFNLNARTFYGTLITGGVNVNSAFSMNIDRQSYGSDGKIKTSASSSSPGGTIIRSVRLVN